MKRAPLDAAVEQRLLDTMRTLNAAASRAALAVDARCATDITGFGLLGHASHIARASGVTLRIRVASVPVLPGARETIRSGAGHTGGAERNDQYLAPLVAWGAASKEDRALLIDPQTSGGLLVAVPADRLADYLSRVDGSVEIGEVVSVQDASIELV
jgi:selenophosphate synthase